VEGNGGDSAPVVGDGGEVVEELQGDVGKLGVEAIRVEEGRREVSHGEQEAAAAFVGGGVSAGIGGRLGVGEHERKSGKLVRGSVRAIGAREWWSTAARGSPEGMKGGRRWYSGSGCIRQRKEMEMDRVASTGSAKQERAEHGSGEVAAGGGSGGRGAPKTGKQGRETRPGLGRGRRVEGGKAGGGRRRPAQRRPGELHRRRSRGGRGNRAEHVLGEGEERGGGPGTCLQNSRIIGTLW
jgi:hypothetical protein